LPHKNLGLPKPRPTACIERIQVNGSAVQFKRFVKAAEDGCRPSRKIYIFGVCWFESNRSLEGSIRSSPIVVDLLLNRNDWFLSIGGEACVCPTKPFTEAYSFKRAAC
jgi:hypothetical protein